MRPPLQPMSVPDEASGHTRRQLTSWKEIAHHVNRSVRTVQEWEKREGLPVHRHRHQRRDSVYAYADELDAWWRQRGAILAEESADAAGPPSRRRPWRWRVLAAASTLLALSALTLALWRDPAPPSPFAMAVLDGPPGGALNTARVGDLNGDGVEDLVLSASNVREVYVVFGGSWPGNGRFRSAAHTVILGTTGARLFGTQTGDFNGDGIADLLVNEALGEPDSYQRSGTSYLVWGRRTWPSTLIIPADANVTLRIDRSPDASMHGCLNGSDSDLNGDGLADVWLSALEYGSGDRRSAGSVFVWYGRREWPAEVEVAAGADVTFRGARMGEGLGWPCVLDARNGATTHVAILADETRLWNMLGGAGRLYMFRHEAWPKIIDAGTDAHVRIEGSAPSARWSVALADVNGDGITDHIAAISRNENPTYGGAVRIWFGGHDRPSPLRPETADVVITGRHAGGRLGERLATTDVDGDGIVDLLLAEPGRGELHLVYGRREWAETGSLEAYRAITVLNGGDGDGWWDIAVGDFDADLLPELAVASSQADTTSGAASGRAWLIKPHLPVRLEIRPEQDPNPVILPHGLLVARVYGSSAERGDTIEPGTLRLAQATPTRFVTGDFNHDGYVDLQLYFDTAAMKVTADTTRLAIRGRNVNGTPIAGTDAVVIVTATEAQATREQR